MGTENTYTQMNGKLDLEDFYPSTLDPEDLKHASSWSKTLIYHLWRMDPSETLNSDLF